MILLLLPTSSVSARVVYKDVIRTKAQAKHSQSRNVQCPYVSMKHAKAHRFSTGIRFMIVSYVSFLRSMWKAHRSAPELSLQLSVTCEARKKDFEDDL